MPEQDLVYLYCGGCGHKFFYSPQVTLEEAKEQAKTLRCHYCEEETKEERKPAYTPKTNNYGHVCPQCGSADFVETAHVEVCNSCGYGLRYS